MNGIPARHIGENAADPRGKKWAVPYGENRCASGACHAGEMGVRVGRDKRGERVARLASRNDAPLPQRDLDAAVVVALAGEGTLLLRVHLEPPHRREHRVEEPRRRELGAAEPAKREELARAATNVGAEHLLELGGREAEGWERAEGRC